MNTIAFYLIAENKFSDFWDEPEIKAGFSKGYRIKRRKKTLDVVGRITTGNRVLNGLLVAPSPFRGVSQPVIAGKQFPLENADANQHVKPIVP